MNLPPEDPRLTAYALGELSADDAAEVANAAAADPAIAAEILEIQAVREFLTDRLALPVDSLPPARREALLDLARQKDRAAARLTFRKASEALKPWLIPLAAAAMLALSTIILTRMPDPTPAPAVVEKTTASATSSGLPLAVIPTPAPIPAPLPEPFLPRGSMTATDTPILDLPVLTAHANLQAVSQTILTENHLPAPATVRLEEILNAFPLRLSGVTAISRSAATGWHPDNRDAGMTRHVATLSTEMLACPWKPSATLLIISLRGNAEQDCDVQLAFHADARNVFRYRLLGFTGTATNAPGKIPAKLAANTRASFALEIEPTHPGAELGSLVWSTDGETAPAITLTRSRAAEPSDDARFAALVCTFAQWLAGEQKSSIDAEILAAFARELASSTLPADRADFLSLIDKSLHL